MMKYLIRIFDDETPGKLDFQTQRKNMQDALKVYDQYKSALILDLLSQRLLKYKQNGNEL